MLIASNNGRRSPEVCRRGAYWDTVKVRIKQKPREHELDGIGLDHLEPGMVRVVPTSLGSWLVAERYADVEMRHDRGEDLEVAGIKPARDQGHDFHRRSTDR